MAHPSAPLTTAAAEEKRPGLGSEPVSVHAATTAAAVQVGVRTAGVHISVLHVLVIGENFHEAS